MLTEDYVSFETAKLLKEKGFDEECFYCFDDVIGESRLSRLMICNNSELVEHYYSAPTLQIAMKWLRTIHNIDIETPAEVGILGTKVYVPMISTYKNRKNAPEKITQLKFGLYNKDDKGGVPALKYYKTKEEACEAAIKYCLENLI